MDKSNAHHDGVQLPSTGGDTTGLDFASAKQVLADVLSGEEFGSVTASTEELRSTEEDGPHVPGFSIHRRLGTGGGGEVWLGVRDGSDRLVAIKIFRHDLANERAMQRIRREIDILERAHLDCVPRILDHGYVDDRLYVVTEFVDGAPLTKYCDEHNLNLRQRAELLAKVCDAVQKLHNIGIIHRDLKPSNILVSDHPSPLGTPGHGDGSEGGSSFPHIIDFGIATFLDSDLRTTITDPNMPLGTPAYMSPEQARGERDKITTQSDVYSLGAVAYDLLLGCTPHDSETTESSLELLHKVGYNPPRDPREVDAKFPKPLAAVLRKATALAQKVRYSTAVEFSNDLRRWLVGEPVSIRWPSIGKYLKLSRRVGKYAAIAFLPTAFILWWFATHQEKGYAILIKSGRAVQLLDSFPNAQLGHAVAAIGDVNGDGYDDVAMGASIRTDDQNREIGRNAGAVYVIFGGPDVDWSKEILIPESLDGTNGFVLFGTGPQLHFGKSISRAGDFDADGIDDFIIGAEGRAYVVLGGSDVGMSGRRTLNEMRRDEIIILEAESPEASFGVAVAGVGDITGDDIADVVVGAHEFDLSGRDDCGAVYIFPGRKRENTGQENDAPDRWRITGAEAHDNFGKSINGNLDFDGDGSTDMVVGAPMREKGRKYPGSCYVFFGPLHEPSRNQPNTEWFAESLQIVGQDNLDWLGFDVAAPGDVDGDGYDDILIGAYQIANEATDAGKVHIVFGGPDRRSSTIIDLSAPEIQGTITIHGHQAALNEGEQFGYQVAAAGDINGDGFADCAIAAPGASIHATRAGCIYIIYGRHDLRDIGDLGLDELPAHSWRRIDGYEHAQGKDGVFVDGGFDINADERDDLILGFPATIQKVVNDGSAIIVFGE